MRSKIITIVLLLCLVLVSSISCNPFGGSEQEATEQLAEVVRGDLTVTVSGSGNLEVINEAMLAFGVGGRVDKVYIEEGGEVSKGEVLARLETDSLELALTEAQVAQTRAEVAVIQVEVTITEAQVTLETAEYNLEEAQDLYARPDVHTARAAVSEAQSYLEYAKQMLAQSSTTKDIKVWTNEVSYAEETLRAAEVSLNEMLSAPDTEEVAIKRLQVEAAQQSLELAEQSLELNKQSLELAKQSLETTRKQLDEATITAPFDGIIASVYAEEGDVISPPTMAPQIVAHLIDPSSMELNVEVDEIDVIEVKPGQRAIIEVDALPTLPIEGKVSFISLTPKEEGSVIVYDVKIDFDVAEGIGLRAGMSATADIVIAERNNVLLVPDRAIKQDSQGNPIVEIMVNGQIEERSVDIGVSDGFQTEIVDGLEEGEVVIERRTKPKSSGSGLF